MPAAFAAVNPTIKAPTNPGRVATATAPRSPGVTPALHRASSIIGKIWRTWARDAISGTTPPIALVQSDLRGDHARKDARHTQCGRSRTFKDRRGRLVAGRLDGQQNQVPRPINAGLPRQRTIDQAIHLFRRKPRKVAPVQMAFLAFTRANRVG